MIPIGYHIVIFAKCWAMFYFGAFSVFEHSVCFTAENDDTVKYRVIGLLVVDTVSRIYKIHHCIGCRPQYRRSN